MGNLQKQDEVHARLYDSDDNLYHTGRLYKVVEWNQTVDDINELGIGEQVEEIIPGVLLVLGKYYFCPSSGKWRKKGSKKYYRSRGFKDFYERFVI